MLLLLSSCSHEAVVIHQCTSHTIYVRDVKTKKPYHIGTYNESYSVGDTIQFKIKTLQVK